MSGASLARFKSEEELDKRCKEYFEKCIKNKKRPSKAGLLVYLDITVEPWHQYKKKFPKATKRADNIIEEAWIERLDGVAATGAIFYLKNAFKEKYRDRYENNISGEVILKGNEIRVKGNG